MVTDAESAQILALRSRLGDKLGPYMQNEWTLVRWLRQYKHDVHEAERRLRSHLRNRRLFGLDRPEEQFQPVEILQKGHPFIWLGTKDKHGCPIAIRQAGRVDVKGMLNCIKTSDYIRHELQNSEKTMRKLIPLQEKCNRPVGMCVLLDLDGLSFDPFTLSLLNSYFKSLEEFIIDQNYPMIDEKVILLNAPRIMTSLCAVLKKLWPYIDKVHILGHDFREKLCSEYADPSQIPVRYGGTLKDEDIPEVWHEPDKIAVELWPTADSEPADTFKVHVKPRRRMRFTYSNVPQSSTITWFFKGDHDIGFSVYWNDGEDTNDSKVDMVVPKHRSKTDMVAESGSYVCARSGAYWLELGNEHSRWSSKTLVTCVTCTSPGGKVLQFTQEEIHAKSFDCN